MTEVLPKIKLGEELLLLLFEEIIVFSKEKCLYHFVTINSNQIKLFLKEIIVVVV